MPISFRNRDPSKIKVGDRYNKWRVLSGPTEHRHLSKRKWLCRCECGKEYLVVGPDLVSGKSPRCRGCGFRGVTPMQVILGISHSLCRRLRKIAHGSIRRCTDQTDPAYYNYGARGITVYAPWVDDVQSFVRYLLTIPGHDDPTLVVDRIDNEMGYEPGNLRFVTWSVSNTNKRKRRGRWTESMS